VWIDFSKGLGAPVGACLAGSRAFIEQAWRYKQALGGAMRQAGIIAAGGVYALRHHVDRLAEDHDNAKLLARGIAELPGIALDPAHVETNIVIFDVEGTGLTAPALADRLMAEAQVRLSVMGETRLRAVTHLDVSRKQVDTAVEAFARILRPRR
jgi:threonine aldolase